MSTQSPLPNLRTGAKNWEYRVVRYPNHSANKRGEWIYAIHEAIWQDGKIISLTEEAAPIIGEDLGKVMELMALALKKPILDWRTYEEVP